MNQKYYTVVCYFPSLKYKAYFSYGMFDMFLDEVVTDYVVGYQVNETWLRPYYIDASTID